MRDEREDMRGGMRDEMRVKKRKQENKGKERQKQTETRNPPTINHRKTNENKKSKEIIINKEQ